MNSGCYVMDELHKLKESLKSLLSDLAGNNPLNELKHTIENKFIYSIPDLVVLTRVKDLDRALEKIERKGYTRLDQFTDLVGIKVIVPTVKDLYSVVSFVNKTFQTISADDYIKHPKESGYKGYHTNFIYKGFNVELQLQTHAMAKASMITHDRFYKHIPTTAAGKFMKSLKRVLPAFIFDPMANMVQRLIFATVIPYEIIKSQGFNGYRQYIKDLAYFNKIDFAPKHVSGDFDRNANKGLSNDIVHEHSAEYLSKLSVTEIVDLRQKLGRELENNPDPCKMDLFNKLDNMYREIKISNVNTPINSRSQDRSSSILRDKDLEL